MDANSAIVLSDADIGNAISLIQAAYDPNATDTAAIESLQNSLMQMQRTRPAWGLIVPLLSHQDPNVQFFGAHTAHVKISRGELESLTTEERDGLRETLLALVAIPGRKAFVQKKLYGTVTALAIRLVPGHPSGWENWIEATVRAMVNGGLGNAEIHKFLTGASEDVYNANLLPQTKLEVQESLRVATPLVLQSIVTVVNSAHQQEPSGLQAALECLSAWYMARFIQPAGLLPLVPTLIALLDFPSAPSAEVLCDILIRPPESWSPAVLIEPMLLWVARIASPWYQASPQPGNPPWYPTAPASPNFAFLRDYQKVFDALGEAAVDWVAAHLVDYTLCEGLTTAGPSSGQPTGPSRASLAQLIIRVMLALTACDEGGTTLPEWTDHPEEIDLDDEFASESNNAGSTLSFWYMLQESLWDVPPANTYIFSAFSSGTSTPPPNDDPEAVRGQGGVGGTPFTPGLNRIGSYSFGSAASSAQANDTGPDPSTQARGAHAEAAYVALVHILRRKCVWRRSWLTNEGLSRSEKEHKDRQSRFSHFRREVGDTLVNAFYILRTDLLDFFAVDSMGRIERGEAWEEIEATLDCLDNVNEAVDLEVAACEIGTKAPIVSLFTRLFGGELWGRLPTSCVLSSAYSNRSLPEQAQERAAINRLRITALKLIDTYASYFTHRPSTELGGPLDYILGALWDQDPQVGAAASIALRGLCDANRHALAERIDSFAAVHSRMDSIPEQFRQKVLQGIASVIQALAPMDEIAPLEAMVTPVVRKLKSALDAAVTHPEAARAVSIQHFEIIAAIAKGLTHVTDSLGSDNSDQSEIMVLRTAREDPRMQAARDGIFECITRTAQLWSDDAEVGIMLSDLFKGITALPDDITLLSLPPAPLLGIVCQAATRKLTALNPPPLLLSDKSGPTIEAEECVQSSLRTLVSAGLGVFAAPGGIIEPDIVQEFFTCMDRVAQDFTTAFCALPDGAFDALIQFAINVLSMQERYSLVASCSFLGTLIHRTALFAVLSPDLLKQLQAHIIRVHGRLIMRAVLSGFAGAAPRSAVNNMLELLSAIVTRWDEQAVAEAYAATDFKPQGGARAWAAEIVFADDFYPSRAGPEAKQRLVKTLMR
ncbi:hypothetical protein MIND_00221600 [Mycena indigotica]|uniref:Exportin-1/Importin-beta-like domain-containing protein n=1 Tax=Mycena indigotica TaxID=2126181 RepID=A0A8H6WEQ2_9AGAR|nr:uncharacterized protein MIND_00221600 [Mycena indigotica]KAF7312093.1 hypothetical protein MIND_00221600 [Mycena indigotica]